MSDCQHNVPGRELETGDVQTQGHQLDVDPGEEALYKLVDCLYGRDGEADIAAIDRYLEELDQAVAEPDEFDVEKGLQQFHQRFDTAFEYRLEESKPARKRRPLARIAIIAAAMCTFIFTAQASGWDIIGAIARWTSEQFSYIDVGTEKDERQEEKQYVSLQDALDAYFITEKLSPTKFPAGTDVSDVFVKKDKGFAVFSASYTLSGNPFYISIRMVNDTPYSEVEINDPNVECYLSSGIEHHIMTDVKQKKASWVNGKWECYILGNLSHEDLIFMIDSIYS